MNTFTVSKAQLITPSVLLLRLRPKRPRDALDFYPGQYAAIAYKNHGRPSLMRCFSIVSSPNNPHELQFAIRLIGTFTKSLQNLEPGDTVYVRGPFGNFGIDESSLEPSVMLAGGIGITPFMSIIRTATEERLPQPITLLYSCRSQNEVPFFNELLKLEAQNPQFKVYFFISDGPTDQLVGGRVLSGRIDEKRLQQLTNDTFNDFNFLLCGPKPFMQGMQDILFKNNTQPSRVLTEDFTPTPQMEALTITPARSIRRWTYGLSAASLLAAIGFFGALDMYQTVAKQVTKQTTAKYQIQANKTTSTSSNTNNTGANNTANATNDVSPSQIYQSPMSSVS